jgi:GT2 family glycosyltransferase
VGAPLPEVGESNRRLRLFLSASLVLLIAGLCAWIASGPLLHTNWPAFLIAYGAIGCSMILLLVVAPEPNRSRRAAFWIFGTAVLCRLILLVHPPSNDIDRYAWEGALIRAGESPYAAPANDSRFEAYRDAHWEQMNHRDQPTAYPPGIELVFAAIPGEWGLRSFFLLCDLGVILLLFRLLTRRGMPVRWAILYAFNPLILMAFAAEGKFDSFQILLVLGALDLIEAKRVGPALLLIGMAIQVKIVAVLLLPLFLRDGGWRKGGWLLPTMLLPLVPFAGDLPRLFRAVLSYGADLSFNGTVHRLACGAGLSRSQASMLMVVILLGFCGFIWRRRHAIASDAGWILAALILLSPTVHYWYLAWLVPFLVLYPSRPWILLTLTFGFYFVTVGLLAETGVWTQPSWAWGLTWLTFFGFAAWEFRHVPGRRVRRRDSGGPPWPAPKTLSVIIPTWNESEGIAECVAAAAAMHPLEILVADGGSTDSTVALAKRAGARVLSSAPGRGIQIRAAAQAARGDVILVLHADARCLPDTGRRVLEALTNRPDAAGGAVGQRFTGDAARLGVLEILNDLRACLLRMSFGDQGQFYRRTALDPLGGYPEMPLMEDVELSLRMRKAGDTLYLWRGLEVSPRDWESAPFFQRMRMVISMTLGYQLRRLFGPVDTDAMFERYYGRKPGTKVD